MLIQPKNTEGIGLIDPRSILWLPRQRTDDAEVRIYIETELVPNIAENGLIHPPVIHFDENGYPIGDVGWCRTQACIALGWQTMPYNLRLFEDRHIHMAIELAENNVRYAMSWQDRVRAIVEIHNERQKKAKSEYTTWGRRETGKLLGVEAARVTNAIAIQSLLDSGNTAVAKAETFTEAVKIAYKTKQDEVHRELAKRHATTNHKAPEKLARISGPLGKKATDPTPAPKREHSKLVPVVELSKMLLNMDCRDFFSQCPPDTFDHIYTDIPYGIDMDNLENVEGIDLIRDSHDIAENLDQMPEFLRGAFKVLKPDKYLYFWYDLKHHEKLQQWAIDVGFTVQPHPIVWIKTHTCRNMASHCWWTKSIETVMVCRKGQATLKSPQPINYIIANGAAEKRLQRNPFSKPFDVSKQLILSCTAPGDLVLDPYAGGGSLLRALLNTGRKIVGIEKDEKQFPILVESIKSVFRDLNKQTVEFS